MPPLERLLTLQLLCERAMDLPEVYEALERRAEFAEAQTWDWESARLLGALSTMPAYQQLRLPPIGRDADGHQ